METSDLSGEIQQEEGVSRETSAASEISQAQNEGFAGTVESSSPSASAIERETETIPEEGSQLHFRTTHVTESTNEEIEMSNVTSSVSLLRSNSWASMEVSATLPRGAHIVHSSNETEVSISSIPCEMQSNKNNSKFSSVIADATVDTNNVSATSSKTVVFAEGKPVGVIVPGETNVDFRTKKIESHEIESDNSTGTESCTTQNISQFSSVIPDATVDTSNVSATSETVVFAEGNPGSAIGPEEKNVGFPTKKTEGHEIKSCDPTGTESTTTQNISPTSLSKVQAFKAFFDGKASAENTRPLVVVDTSIKSISDEGANIETASNNKMTPSQNSEEGNVTVLEAIPETGYSSTCEEIKEIESVDPVKLNLEKSEDSKKEKDGKEKFTDNKNEKGQEPFVSSTLKSEEKQTDLKNLSSLVLPIITITGVSDVEDDSEDSDEELVSGEPAEKVSTEIEKVENEAKLTEEIEAGEDEAKLSEEIEAGEDEAKLSEEIKAGEDEAKLSEEIKAGEDEAKLSEEIKAGEDEAKLSEEIKAGEDEAKLSEEIKHEHFKHFQPVSHESETSDRLEMVKNEANVDLRSVGNVEIAGTNDNRMTFDIYPDSNQSALTEETSSNKEQTAAATSCSPAVHFGDSEVSDEPEQVEERKAVFYISSSEIQPGRLERAGGYTNLAFEAFEDSDGTCQWQRQRPIGASFSPLESRRSGACECLGSRGLHLGIFLSSMFVVYIGYSLYMLALNKRVPDIYETVGLSTSAIAGGIALLSSLYIGVQWCGRNCQNMGYMHAPLDYSGTMSLDSCGHYHHHHHHHCSTEAGFVDVERACRHHETRDNVLRMQQDQPSTSGLPDSTQKLKTEVTGLLETLADVISEKTLRESADADFTGEEMEAGLNSSPDSSEPSVYASAELPPGAKDSAQEDAPTKKDR